MELDDRSTDRKAKDETALVRREKRLEHALFLRLRQPGTAVGNTDVDPAFVRDGSADCNGAPRRCDTVHCIHRVHEKIEQDLLQLYGIAMCRRQIDGFFVLDRDPTPYQLTVKKPKG